jgi:predicted metal-dependent hydrolase
MNNVRIEHIDTIGTVRLHKKRGVKRVSLRIHQSGEIRVTQPLYLPFSAGVLFAKSHTEWIMKQKQKQQPLHLYDAMPIGKLHELRYETATKFRTRLNNKTLSIYAPHTSISMLSDAEIMLTKKAIKRVVNTEAKQLLPDKVAQLAIQKNYSYNSITIKPLKSRWGSCSHRRELTFNCYLMMLPWDLIDYVIVHELAHTVQMNHSTAFWHEVAKNYPNFTAARKDLKRLQPSVHAFYV